MLSIPWELDIHLREHLRMTLIMIRLEIILLMQSKNGEQLLTFKVLPLLAIALEGT